MKVLGDERLGDERRTIVGCIKSDLQYLGVGATVCRHLPLLDGSVQVHSR